MPSTYIYCYGFCCLPKICPPLTYIAMVSALFLKYVLHLHIHCYGFCPYSKIYFPLTYSIYNQTMFLPIPLNMSHTDMAWMFLLSPGSPILSDCVLLNLETNGIIISVKKGMFNGFVFVCRMSLAMIYYWVSHLWVSLSDISTDNPPSTLSKCQI